MVYNKADSTVEKETVVEKLVLWDLCCTMPVLARLICCVLTVAQPDVSTDLSTPLSQ